MSDVLDELHLTEDQFNALAPTQQEEYLNILQAEASGWSLRRTPKAMRGHLLACKVDHTLLGGAASGGKVRRSCTTPGTGARKSRTTAH